MHKSQGFRLAPEPEGHAVPMLGIALTFLSPVASGLCLSAQMPRGFNFKDMPTLEALALCGFFWNPHSLCQELQLPLEEQLAPEPRHFPVVFGKRSLGNQE